MSQPVGRTGREPTSHSTQHPASLPLGVDRQLGRKRLRIREALPQEPLACQLPPSPTSVVWGSLTPLLERKLLGFLGSRKERLSPQADSAGHEGSFPQNCFCPPHTLLVRSWGA